MRALYFARSNRRNSVTFGEGDREKLFELTTAVAMACRKSTKRNLVGQIVTEKT
jgi:hypothetical protein